MHFVIECAHINIIPKNLSRNSSSKKPVTIGLSKNNHHTSDFNESKFIKLSINQARHHGGHFGAVPPQITACAPPPKQEMCPSPPSEDCVLKKITSSVPLGCSFGVRDPLNTDHQPTTRGQKTVFSRFRYENLFPFFSVFTSRIRRKLHIHRDESCFVFFGLHPRNLKKFAHLLRRRPFLVLVFTLEFEKKKVFVPPKNYLCPPPPSHATLAPGLR